MKLMFVYRALPVLVFFTDNVRKGFGGTTYGPIITIRKKYKNDIGLIEHELVHSKQWYRTLATHGIWYWLSDRYRLKCEVEAYRTQALHYDYDASDWMADAIVNKYNIDGVTKQQAIDLLKS